MKSHQGLALTLALNCLALLLLTTLCTQAFLLVEVRAAAVHAASMRVRMDLRQACILGLARLQAQTGRDDVAIFSKDGHDWCASSTASAERLSSSLLQLPWDWKVRDLSLVHDIGAERRAALNADAWVSGPWGRGKVPLRKAPEPPSVDELMALELRWSPEGREVREIGSRGLPTDPLRGGFRHDLGAAGRMREWLGQDVHSRWNDGVRGVDPLSGMDLGRSATPCPLLVEIVFSIGIFNSRADGRHRIRFHGSGKMWNDLGLGLATSGRGRMLMVELKGAPVVSIRNLDSGAVVEADLDDLPVLDLGTLEQGRRERSLWFMTGVEDPPLPPMKASGLLAGEVYGFISPSPASQPQGLSRILSDITWRMDRRPHGPSWRRPSPEVMLPSDRIHITVRFDGESSWVARRYAGDPAKDMDPDEYPGEICQSVGGLRFEPLVIETTAEEFSRPDSSGYRIAERRLRLATVLDLESPQDLIRWANETRRMRSPSSGDKWRTRHPLAFGGPDEDFRRSPSDLLWDESPNVHGSSESHRFCRVTGREHPLLPVISAGTLGRLGATDWSRALDTDVIIPGVGETSHPRLRPWRPFPRPIAEDWFVDGAFNVNSCDREAWIALLWSAGPVSGSAGSAFFPTLPSVVDVPLVGLAEPRLRHDHELEVLPPDVMREVSANQPGRLLGRSQVERLADAICAEIVAGGPFRSLEEFFLSGVLERALSSAGVNRVPGPIAEGLPLWIDACDLMELFGPQLCVRGDTFRMEVSVSDDRGSAAVSLVVQRTPDTESLPSHLGRRLRIISIAHPEPGFSHPSGLTAGPGG